MAKYSVWRPHSVKQELAVFSQSAIVLLATGIQFGKTECGAMRMKIAMHTHRSKRDNFLVVAPTYKIMSQSTLPAFLRVMRDAGEYSKVAAEFRMHGGGTAYFRTATDPDSIVGVTNIRHIWGDEAGKYSLYFWENIQARAAFREAPVTLTTSPYTLNWIYKELILPKMKQASARPDCNLIQAASWENPYFPKGSVDTARKTMDPRRFNMMFGGQWERAAGLVYDCFSEDENVIEPFSLPTGTRFFGGIDWGYTDPFCLMVMAIAPNGRRYFVSETYKTGLTINDIVDVCRQKRAVFSIERFYCGPDQPGHIDELCRSGLPAVGADNAIRLGIDRHYELLKTRQLKLFKGACPHLQDEYDTYHYPDPDNLRPDQDSEEQNPVGQWDHANDSARYVIMGTWGAHMKLVPKVPNEQPKKETEEQKLKRLMQRRRYGGQTETW